MTTHAAEFQEQGLHCEVGTFGQRAKNFFSHYGVPIEASVEGLGDNPTSDDIIGLTRVMLDAYDAKKIDKLYLASNEFETTMSQKPVIEQLLPLPESDDPELKIPIGTIFTN